MGINVTLVGQLITFAIFVWFTMRFVWPPIIKTMREREQHITEGLIAAEQGQQVLAQAQREVAEQLRAVKQQATAIIEQADERAVQIIAAAKDQAKLENHRLLTLAQAEIEQEWIGLKQRLRNELADLVVVTMARLLTHTPADLSTQRELINQAIAEI